MKSLVAKRSIVVGGHKTSVSLEDAFWYGMKVIAGERKMTLSELVGSIDASREHANLSSAIRLFVLGYYMNDAERQPHSTRQRFASDADKYPAGGPIDGLRGGGCDVCRRQSPDR